MIYKMTLKDSVDTMTFNLLETPIVDKDIEGAVDNVTLDGNQYTDYLYLKKQYIQKWAIMCPDEYDELRGFYTRQFEDGEVPSYRVYYGANVTRDYTLNGDYFQFNAEGIETGMTLSQLLGNAEQTTYSGKNLFDFGKFISDNVSVQGVTRGTATYTSNSITLTATSNDCFTKYNFPSNLYPVIAVSQNTDVTLSWKTNNTSGTNRGVVYVFGNNNGAATVIINAQDRAGYCTFNTGSYTEISFRVGVANSGDTLTYSDIQVEIGSAPTAYEKFVGGTTSPNPDYPQDINVVTGGNTVVIYGKNSLSAPQDYTEDRDGLVFTCTDGVYNISGNASSGNVTADHDITQPYTIREGDYWHLCNDFTDTHIQIALIFTDGSIRNYSPGNVVNRIESLSAYAGKTVSKIRFYYNSGYNINGNIKPMILNGVSTATDFIPYQGQSQEINLGKNLWGGFTYTWTSNWNFDTIFNDDGSFSISGNASTSTWSITTAPALANACIKLEAGTYTFSFSGTASRTQLVSVRPDGTGEAAIADISAASGSSTFTLTETRCLYPRMKVSAGDTSLTEKCMIQVGSQETSYAPYFTPIELSKVGNYQDRIYKSDGKWYIEKQIGKVVLDGTEAWGYNGTDRVFVVSDLVDYMRTGFVPMSDYYTGQEITAYSQLQDMHIAFLTSTNSRTVVKNTNYTTANDFKAWLAAHNTTVYYQLATPTTTEITDETLLSQLNFLASLYEGENNISLVGTGAQGEMEVFIRDVMSVETDVVPEVPVRLTLTDDGVINACGCRRNVQLTMRETTE